MVVVSRLKHLAKYGAMALASLVMGSIISLSAYAQTMNGENASTSSLQQIICGEQLCTIGDPGNGGRHRVCWEVDKGEGECDYSCQGWNEEKPKACEKSGVLCRSVTESRAGCIRVNGGNPISSNPSEVPAVYKDYKEAEYTYKEFMNMPRCPHRDSVTGECRCDDRGDVARAISSFDHARGNDRICQKDQVCIVRDGALTDVYQCVAKDSKEAQGINDGLWQDGEIRQLTSECPTYAEYVEKYGSGCWSCLVLEKLTSSFLSAASAGLKICQEAGITLLILGFAIWLAFWALKNVSSFTEIKGSNILNDLLKMGAKIVIAYCCITAGPTAIREFVIRPIIGLGATIAQNFWYTPDDAKSSGVDSKYMQGIQAESFDWDMPLDIDQASQDEANRAAETPPVTSETETEETEEKEDIAAMDAEINEKFEIPAFQIPGVDGSITSFPGCRIPPITPGDSAKGPSCGSYAHMGLDVGAPKHSRIWAMAGGKITYQQGGWGSMAWIRTVQHTKNGDVTWDHLYAHMDCSDWSQYKNKWNGKEVTRGEIIGGVGGTGTSSCDYIYGPHLHVEIMLTGTVGGKTYQNALLDPVSLAEGKILVRGHKNGPTIVSNTVKEDCDCRKQNVTCQIKPGWSKPDQHCGVNYTPEQRAEAAGNRNNRFCKGFVSPTPNTLLKVGSRFPMGGVTTPGTASVDISGLAGGGYVGGSYDFGSMRVEIPEVKYSGPTDIMPKSVMNSILGATKAITFNTAQYQILGEMVMCYSQVRGGGAHHIDLYVVEFYWTNFGMWIAGAILWFLGFMLTCVVSFYLVDMSFKIGFAVMALPIVMGLWPFKATQGKLSEVVAIIAKASCDFAFLALTTYFGLNLVAGVYGSGIEGLFNDYDKIITETAGSDKDTIVTKLNDTFYLFSSTFLLLLFAIIYAYKLVSQTSKDLVEKFFPDGAFGSASPMHKALTGAASMVNRLNKKYGMGLAADMAANGAGKAAKWAGGKATGAIAAAPKAALNAARRGINKLKGGGKK